MSDVAWRTISGRLGWLVAATFVIGMVFFATRQFHLLVPEPDFAPDGTFVDNLLAGARHQQDHWGEVGWSARVPAEEEAGLQESPADANEAPPTTT